MNLTGRPVYQKGQRLTKGANNPTKVDRARWSLIIALGCIAQHMGGCSGRMTIQHCGTGIGRRKDHKRVIGLCWGHHLGPEGIDGKKMSKRQWEEKYGTEELLMWKTEQKLRKHRED